MFIEVELTRHGFALSIKGQNYQAPPCEFRFPEEIWASFPAKQSLVNELAYVTTLVTPLILKHPHIHYNIPIPRFIQTYHECFEKTVPNLVEWISAESSEEVMDDFRSISPIFADLASPPMLPRLKGWNPRRVVLPLSFGKDSLLNLATLRTLGYEVIPVNIDERTQPRWNIILNDLIKRMQKEHDLTCLRVENQIHLLSDYQVLERPETRLYQMQVHFGYLYAMIPFCSYFKAPTIILSDEYVNTLNKVHREGYLCAHKYMQSQEGVSRLADIIAQYSSGQITLANPLGGLGNFAIHRILHEEFPEYGNYRVSCHLEMSDHDRWCHACERCAQAYIFSSALGRNPEEMNFKESMLQTSKKEHYRVFGQAIHKEDAFRRHIRNEESLALLMADKSGVKGPLMELFRALNRNAAATEIKKLQKQVFKINAPPKHKLERDAISLYKKYLTNYAG
jgi:hypothetical protein